MNPDHAGCTVGPIEKPRESPHYFSSIGGSVPARTFVNLRKDSCSTLADVVNDRTLVVTELRYTNHTHCAPTHHHDQSQCRTAD